MRGVWTALGALAALILAAPSGGAKSPFPISKPRWLAGVQITEYYSAPERWFVGRKVLAPGLTGKHRVDWLYSSAGIAMEGDGVGLDGLHYHLSKIGTPGWVTAEGKKTAPGPGGWTRGWPAWRFGGWRNADGAVTFPLETGGWSNEKSVKYVKPQNVLFEDGSSRPLRPWRMIAVDPQVIPLGSRVFIPAYCASLGHAWFTAADTGGAITGRHVDVYRNAPKERGGDKTFSGERIYVIPPAVPAPSDRPTCASPNP